MVDPRISSSQVLPLLDPSSLPHAQRGTEAEPHAHQAHEPATPLQLSIRPSSPLTLVLSVRDNDILLGRGLSRTRVTGNYRFRQLIRTFSEDYNSTGRHCIKQQVARAIRREIQRRGGRFLASLTLLEARRHNVPLPKSTTADETSGDSHGVWYTVHENVLMTKIKQALRDTRFPLIPEPQEPALPHPSSAGVNAAMSPTGRLERASFIRPNREGEYDTRTSFVSVNAQLISSRERQHMERRHADQSTTNTTCPIHRNLVTPDQEQPFGKTSAMAYLYADTTRPRATARSFPAPYHLWGNVAPTVPLLSSHHGLSSFRSARVFPASLTPHLTPQLLQLIVQKRQEQQQQRLAHQEQRQHLLDSFLAVQHQASVPFHTTEVATTPEATPSVPSVASRPNTNSSIEM